MMLLLLFCVTFGIFCRDCSTQKYPLFKQCDPKWGHHQLGSSKTDTICMDGCLMSSVSMSLNGKNITIDGEISTPLTLNAWLDGHGGYVRGDDFVFASVDKFGYSFLGEPVSKDILVKYICSNHVVILNVHNGGHWVLAVGVNDDGYNVNDPYFSTTNYPFDQVVRSAVYSSNTTFF